jgi:type II secretory pathway component PulJ
VKSQTLDLAMAAAVLMSIFASAQTVDQLMADRVLRNAELERCKQLGMASVQYAGCKTARQAENSGSLGSVRPTRLSCQ